MPRPAPGEPDAARLTLLYTFVFVEIGIAMPFMPVWLNALGIDPAVIGGLVALPIAVRIVATAPLMSLIDRGVGARAILAWGSLGNGLTYALMPFAAPFGWGALAVLIALNAVASAPLVACIDYLTLAAARRSAKVDYARIRLWGSVGFLAANLAGGLVLGWLGERTTVPLLLTVLALIASAVAFASPEAAAREAPHNPDDRGAALPGVLKLTIAAAALVQASHAAIYAFGSIAWSEAGLSGAWIGALWAIGVAAEIALFAVIGRLPARWRSPFLLIGLGACAAMLRAFGLSVADGNLPLLLGVQMLHALTFGATHFGAMQAVSRFAPEGARGRAQGTLSASTALASAGATLASGAVFHEAGAAATFLMMAPLALAGLVLVVLAGRTRFGHHDGLN